MTHTNSLCGACLKSDIVLLALILLVVPGAVMRDLSVM
jgi:hypothetical protein